jgi:acyl-coenzyme A thioesterase 13
MLFHILQLINLKPPKLTFFAPSQQVGKTLAYTSIRFLNYQNELVARGSHTKYGTLSPMHVPASPLPDQLGTSKVYHLQ